MQDAGKILVASQFYPPDSSTTAAYIAAIAEAFAIDNPVVVLSGSVNSAAEARNGKPEVVEIGSWTPQKDALIRRSMDPGCIPLKTPPCGSAETTQQDQVSQRQVGCPEQRLQRRDVDEQGGERQLAGDAAEQVGVAEDADRA